MKCQKCKKKKSGLEGVIYALIPHAGCIMFIIASVIGSTLLTELFKPLLMNKYFFYYLLALSFGFATLSSYLYLRKNKASIKQEWKYLTIMYSITIGINLVLFNLIFPALANVNYMDVPVSSLIVLTVNIPCSGHAPLIISELKNLEGINSVKFDLPNKFLINYDSSKVNVTRMLALPVFIEYPAVVN
jgi:hypothetical protein